MHENPCVVGALCIQYFTDPQLVEGNSLPPRKNLTSSLPQGPRSLAFQALYIGINYPLLSNSTLSVKTLLTGSGAVLGDLLGSLVTSIDPDAEET